MTEQNTTDDKAFDLRNKTICITGTLRQMDRESATAWAELELVSVRGSRVCVRECRLLDRCG